MDPNALVVECRRLIRQHDPLSRWLIVHYIEDYERWTASGGFPASEAAWQVEIP